MRAVGIVCEYNPFHRGHLWQISELRRTEDAAVVCAMSGDFVQRGEAAVFDKFARAEAACRCGADLVVELPLPWCLSSAEGFARGAVGMLAALGCGALSFGSESGELEPLETLAELLIDPMFQARVKERLTRQPKLSYAAARELEAKEAIGEAARLLEQPNDILAIEYLKAIRSLELQMRALPILRKGSGHDRDAEPGELRSASELRRMLRAGASIEQDVPPEAYTVFRREIEQGRALLNTAAFETAALSRLLTLSEEDWLALPDADGGLGQRMARAAHEQGSLEDICCAAQTRRYPLARVRRLCLCACLGVRAGLNAGIPPYARVLAANERGRSFLRQRAGESLPILTKPAAVRALGERETALFALGAQAHDLYALTREDRAGFRPEEDWRRSPTMV